MTAAKGAPLHPVSPSLAGTQGGVVPPIQQQQQQQQGSGIRSQEEYDQLRNAKTVQELLASLKPEQQTASQRHTGNAKWSALADVMGSAAGIYSTMQGGPVVSPTMKHEQHLSMYEKLLQQYEHDKRAHDLMTVQNEIANLQGYGDYQVRQQQEQEKARYEQMTARQKQDYDLERLETQHKFNTERDQSKAGADLEKARIQNEAALKLQNERNKGSATVASIRAKDKDKDKDKETQSYALYDQYGQVKHEISFDEVDDYAAIILDEIHRGVIGRDAQGGTTQGVGSALKIKHTDGKPLTAEDKNDLITIYWQQSPGVRDRITGGKNVRNKEEWKESLNDPQRVRSRVRQAFPDASQAELEDIMKELERMQ
jgi:hypothetical protein